MIDNHRRAASDSQAVHREHDALDALDASCRLIGATNRAALQDQVSIMMDLESETPYVSRPGSPETPEIQALQSLPHPCSADSFARSDGLDLTRDFVGQTPG